MASDNNLEWARSHLDPGQTLYHVVLDGPPGVTFSGYVPAATEEEAIEAAKETMCALKFNDFDCKARRV